jgi:NAD(P)-dependent dehydrogenase (short-subunit alcohol dehydrogenase family)
MSQHHPMWCIYSFLSIGLANFVSAREEHINILVNNAGIGGVKNRSVKLPPDTSPEEFSTALLECTQKTWDDVMHINTSSVYFATGLLMILRAIIPF